ncbi:Fanconi anemia core complex-associated protein 100 isoform X1 [Ranitomeya imitator]|uniref:Fanconi anemia core complex-associated protein 100 isoform X1 n=1 Tax=Ranitomeya imitator TaxID=111125 RepID=UPI0037E94356
MSQIEHLVTLQSLNNGLSQSKARIVCRGTDVYICNGTKFVYVFSAEKKQITAVYLFPTNVWHIEVSMGRHQLYTLCAQNGLYLLEWDQHGRLLREPSSAMDKGDITIYQIGSTFGLLLDPALCSFTVASKFLIVAVAQQEQWKIRVYTWESPNLKDSLTMPSREVEFSPRYGASSADLQPVLCCVSVRKDKAIRADAPCEFALDAALFTKLFGVDVALLESPIILCGFPDGQVVYFPLKSTGVHPSTNQNTTHGGSKLLYHLEQSVVSIGAIRMDPDTEQPSAENRASDCLLIVGQKGLIVFMTSGENPENISCTYKDHTLLTPVSGTFYSTSGVFCCTASDLIYVTLCHPEKKAETRTTCATVSSLRHNIPMIAALSQMSSLDDTQLIALSKKGCLMLCKLNQKEIKDHQHGLSRANTGQKIKELLSGIGSVSERLSTLKTVANQKSRSLAKLNQVMSFSRELLSGQSETSPVRCVIRVSWAHVLQKSYVTTCCSLENKSGYTLEHGWNLCVLIRTDPITSYSFPVLLLKPGELQEFAFPLYGEELSSINFPITISCSLFYSLKGFAADCVTPSELDMFSSHKHGVCVPVQDHIIDLLQCLRLTPLAAHCFGLSHTFLKDAVQDIWKSAYVSDTRWTPSASVSNQGLNCTEPLKASVRLSATLLARTLQNDNSGRSLCSAVLHWLLSELLMKEQDVQEVEGVTPDGKEFCIRVQEVSVSDLTSGGSIQAVELQILSSYLHVVASLHLAVISRIKILLQQDKPNEGSQAPGLNLGKIQQLVSAHEPLLKEVKNLRERLGADEDVLSSVYAQRLFHIYRDLRDPGLLFI